ncbi:50S ribosomal protein L5 [Candidatus Kaiserbacteria bacterium CG10_big_fil_rev_8_21_14_0_10_56_12]|uniref:Large ribosomal subunit protein uL5 n=1 Tax=Candidatus Kaiserbacteria bacterium CG10_big_fil_rev_8_21_14_0_10_56_12 TaxID=1974611 RepID=A0A2H0U9L6_9BACT|nr:MAG: 50S ribosomal protein L5 [Candidatus Kaiserbacteria bacterium CG10_big_fil_rev_8_21_14_0_10_56_12]
MSISKQRQQEAYAALAETFGYTSPMQGPRINKVVVSTGVGKKRDKKQIELISDRLSKITGQKPSERAATMSIASFKLREGEIVGLQVTLRGTRMYDFLDKLIHVALPRTRDFRGLSAKSIDEMGNMTVGLKESTIFPETSDEDLKDVFGLAVTIVTTAKSKAEAEAFFRHLGMPLIVDSSVKR